MANQAFLDGIRSMRQMGQGDIRSSGIRSADQDQTQSGNPGTVFNAPRFGPNNKMPPQSFHQQRQFMAPRMGAVRGGAPGEAAEMQAMAEQLQARQQPLPIAQQRFNAPRFSNSGQPFRGRQMYQ